MKLNHTSPLVLALVAFAAAGCETRKSANPLSPDIAGPIPGVSITAPKPLERLTGQQIVADGNPLEQSTRIERVFIQGREVALSDRQTRLRDKYLAR